MGRTLLTIVNPDAESVPAAPWVNATNVLSRGGGSFAYAGAWSFVAQNNGAYEFYQDVAIPSADYAQVDAGTRTVEYEAYGAMVAGFPSTLTLYLKALNGGGATIQTWSQGVLSYGKPYTPLTVRLDLLPALTRTLRVGWSGVNSGAGGGWVDGLFLALDDKALTSSKANSYVVLGAGGPGRLWSVKAISYLILAPNVPETQRIKVRLMSVPMATA